MTYSEVIIIDHANVRPAKTSLPANQFNNTICLKILVYTMVYSGPTWLVNFLVTRGENHSLHTTFPDLKNVRPRILNNCKSIYQYKRCGTLISYFSSKFKILVPMHFCPLSTITRPARIKLACTT